MKRFTVILVLVLAVLSMGTKAITAEKTFKAIASPFPPFTSPDLENNGLAWRFAKQHNSELIPPSGPSSMFLQ